MARYTAGEASVTIVPDLRGFNQKLRSELRSITPKVDVELNADLSALRNRLAAERFTVKVDLEPDLAGLRARLAAERLRARLDVDVDVDLAALRARLAGMGGRVRVGVDVDRAGIAGLGGLTRGLSMASGLSAVLSSNGRKAAGAIAGIGAAAPTVVALATALGTAAGAAAVLPGLLAGAGAAFAAIKIGTSGIGDAFKALTASDQAAATSGGATAKARETQAKQMRDAVRGVADAQRAADRTARQGAEQVSSARQAVADAATSASRRVADAEKTLARAQQDARDAQEGLTRARRDARESLEDLKLSLSGAALSEESAQIGLERAQQRLQEALASGAQGLDLREAQLGVKQASQSLAEARERYVDVKDEAELANRAGVEGSAAVVAAQRQVRDANTGVRDAEAELTQARTDGARDVAAAQAALARTQRDASEANADAARAVVRAQEQVQEASKAAGEETSSAAAKASAAMAKLSPNARAFVDQIRALKPAWDGLQMGVQDALFANFAATVRDLANAQLPGLKAGLIGIAGEFNRGAREVGGFLASARGVADVNTILGNTTTASGFLASALAPLTQMFTDFAVVGSGFLPQLAEGFAGAAQRAADFIANARQTGELAGWIQAGFDAIRQFGELLGNIIGIFGGIAAAAQQAGTGTLAPLLAITQAIEDMVKSVEGQQALTMFFQTIHAVVVALQPALQAFLSAVFQAFMALAPALAPLAQALSAIVVAATPLLVVAAQIAGMLGGFLAQAVQALMPLLSAVAQVVGQVLTAALRAIAPIIPTIVTAISMLAAALAPVVAVAGQVVVVLLNALAPVLPVIAELITTLVRAISPLLGLIAPLVSALLPPLVTIITAVIGVFEVLAPVIGQVIGAIVMLVVKALTPILPMLGELFQVVADSIVPILPQLAGLFMAVIAAVLPLLPPLLDLVAQLLPALIEVIKFLVPIITWLVGIIVDVLTWAIDNILAPALRFIAGLFTWVGDVWRAFGDGMQWVYDHIIAPMINFFVEKGQWLKDKFFEFTDWIGRKWSELQDMFKTPINWVIREVWNKGVGGLWRTAKGIIPALPDWQDAHEFASGGLLPGYRPGVDSIPAVLSPGEAILRPEVGRAMGKAWVDRINATAAQRGPQGVSALLRYGGDTVPRFAAGGIADPATVNRAKNFARSQDGKPYQWAGVGNPSWDCSGFMSGVLLSILGKNAFGTRVGTTATMPWRGFERGADPGGFTIGNTANAGGGIGHMAGTLAGMAVESNGSQGVMAGRGRGSQQGIFTGIYHLAGLTDGTSILDDIGNWISGVVASIRSMIEPIYDGAANGIRSLVSGVFGNGQGWDAFPMASTNSLLDGVKAQLFGKADEMDAVGAASSAVEAGPVQEAVRAIASRYGWNAGAQWDSIIKLVQGESGWNPNAANPTSSARGLFQKMTSLHGPIEPTAGGQALWGLEYIKRAYGDPVSAYSKWSSRSPHWYDTGGWLPPGATMSMNGTGAPEAVLTGRQWSSVETLAARGATGATGDTYVIHPSAPMDEVQIARETARIQQFNRRTAV